MLASIPASILNQNRPDLGILNRFRLKSFRFRPLIGAAVAQGGHVRVGLEDAPWGTPLTNRDWVQEAVRLIRDAGGQPANAAEVRASLKAIDPTQVA